MPVTVDLPAFNVVPPSGLPDSAEAGYLSAVDGDTIMYTSDAQPIAVGNFGDGPGAPGSYVGVLPDVFGPAGFNWATVTEAVYVVRARATSTDAASGDLSEFTPVPTTFPFLFCDYIGAPDELAFDPLTTTMTELVTVNDPATIAARLGRVRLWPVATSSGDIEVDYFALRVTYEPVYDSPPPLRLTRRRDMYASAPSLTRHTSQQGTNRLTGYL